MFFVSWAAARPAAALLRAVFLGGLVALTGCATHYVDGSVKDVPASQFTKPAQPKPAQLVFEFQTKGAANTRATEQIKPMVLDSLKASGLFAQVDDKPLAGGNLISVTINNVVLTDDAFSKGFMTGLTFGAAGSTVTDGYICTVKYLAAGPGGTAITKTTKHAIHTSLGSAGAPPNSVKAASIEEAVRTMVRQIVSNALSDLSRDPAFK
jgi:hypothetical protein